MGAIPQAVQATIAAVARKRAAGLAKRRRPLPKQRYPKLIEFEYARAMVGLLDRARSAFDTLLHELPALVESATRARQDDQGSEGDRARRLIEQAQERMRAAIQPVDVERLATQFATRTERWNRDQLGRQVKAGLGVDLMTGDRAVPAMVNHFVGENVQLIRSIPEDVAAGIGQLVTRALSSGMPHPELAEHIERRFAVGESRARLIARDQIGKLNGQVNASRQRSLGITSFVWRTVGDERVRDEHADRDGDTFSYDDPPDGELPGEPIQCRCSAEPVFEDILDPDPDVPDTAADVTNESRVHDVPAQDIEDRGYYEPEAGFDDDVRLEKAKQAIREGQRQPVRMVVGHTGALEVADGRHRLRAAIELGANVKIRYARGLAGLGQGLVKRGGKTGG